MSIQDKVRELRNQDNDVYLEDETVKALLPGYIQRRKQEINTLNDLLNEGNFEEIRIIGHNLKGSGGLYGLPKIGEFGADIEQQSLATDQNNLAYLFSELDSYLQAVSTKI